MNKKKTLVTFIIFFNFIFLHAGQTVDFVDVTKLGIVGDGKTNNTILLKNITSKYKNLYFPDGDYLFDTWFISQNNVIIKGQSKVNTKLVSTGKINDHAVVLNGQYISLSSLTINGGGNKMNKPSKGDGASCLNISRASRNVSLQNIKFENAYNKQLIVLGSNITVKQCDFVGNLEASKNYDGIHLYGGTKEVSNININNCSFKNLTRSGVYSDVYVSNVDIDNCLFDNSTKSYGGTIGIIIQGGGDNFKINSNKFLGLSRGINLRNGASNINIQGNSFDKVYANAIMFSVSDNVQHKVTRETAYKATLSARNIAIANKHQVGFSNVRIINNSALISKFNNRIIERNSNSFVLISGSKNFKTVFKDVVVQGSKINNASIPLKSLVYVNINTLDNLEGIDLVENSYSGNQISYFGNSKNRSSKVSIK